MDTEVYAVPDTIQHAMGDLWGTFLEMIPKPQGAILTQSLALILMSDEDSLVPNFVNDILIDEETDVVFKKMTLYGLLTNNIIHTLTAMGFVVSEHVTCDQLEKLNGLIAFLFELEEYEDLIGLSGLLDSTDIPPVHRYVDAMNLYNGGMLLTDDYEELLDDVSEVVLKTVSANLLGIDPQEAVSELLQKRVRANKRIFDETLAFLHVTHNGGLGSPPETYMDFFQYELNQLLMVTTPAAQLKYAQEVIALHLISDVNDGRIAEVVLAYLEPIITDMAVLTQVEQLVNNLVLSS